MTTTSVVPESIVAVTLGARDIAAQRRFYEAWGWKAVPYSTDEYVAFTLAGTMLAFYVADKLTEEASPGSSAPPSGAWKGVTLAVNVPARDDVNPTWQSAVSAGATPVSEPVDRAWGGRSGYLADPEGNRWEIAWIPPMA